MLKNLYEDDFKESKYVLIDEVMYIKKQYKVAGDYTKLLNEIKDLDSIYLKQIRNIEFKNNMTTYYEQYIQGTTLDKIDFNKLTIKEVKSIFNQITMGLKKLHDNNLIHRDIKPQNIIINEYHNIKIIDFDIVRKESDSKNKDTVLLGTNKYASPEHFGFGETNKSSDIYSFGVTMSELILSTIHYNQFKNIIKNATNIDSSKRYKNFDELSNAICNVKDKPSKLNSTVNLISLFDIVIINMLIIALIFITEETTNLFIIIGFFLSIYLTTKVLNRIKYSNKSFLIYLLYSFILIIYYAIISAIYEMLYI